MYFIFSKAPFRVRDRIGKTTSSSFLVMAKLKHFFLDFAVYGKGNVEQA